MYSSRNTSSGMPASEDILAAKPGIFMERRNKPNCVLLDCDNMATGQEYHVLLSANVNQIMPLDLTPLLVQRRSCHNAHVWLTNL